MRKPVSRCFSAAAVASLWLAFPIQAQIENTRTYTPADFIQFAPRTARDMVARVPGFRLPSGGSGDDVRGFGEASTNVLINGQRPSAKSIGINTLLDQIPAETVVQIELLDGASLDIPGLSGLAVNVVVKNKAFSGTWVYEAQFFEDVEPFLDGGQLSVSGQRGDLSWSIGLRSRPERESETGRENRFDPARTPLSVRNERATEIGDRVSATATLNWTPASGLVANLNTRIEAEQIDERERTRAFIPAGTLDEQSLFEAREDLLASEVGGDLAFDLGPGRLKLIGLWQQSDSPYSEQDRAFDDGGALEERAIFDQDLETSEAILRSEYRWAGKAGHDWQISFEGAKNSLESTTRLFEQIGTGALTEVGLDEPLTSVEETRGEAFITHGRTFGERLEVQLSVGAEVSRLSSTGAGAQTRNFTRPKGSLTANWDLSSSLSVSARLERQVGQLDFFDFVSTVDLDQGDDQAGNVDIVPDQAWRAEIDVEKDFGKWGATSVLVFAEEIEDIIDQVPIGTDEGPGNLDQASRLGVEVEGTLNFGPLGWTGAQLTYFGTIRDSEVEDPLTGQTRRINEDLISNIEVELRHDIDQTDWAWGLEYQREEEAKIFRLDSVRLSEEQPGDLRAFIEHKDIFGLTAQLSVRNLFDSDLTLERQRFTPDRTALLSRFEERTRTEGRSIAFTLQGTF